MGALTRFLATLCVCGLVLWPAHAWSLSAQHELTPGSSYVGGTRVYDPAHVLSFVLPVGWTGRIPLDSEALVLESQDRSGVGIVISLDDMTMDRLAERLSEPQDFGDSLLLQLSRPLESEGTQLKAAYLGGNVIGRARAVLGPDGHAVVFFFAGPSDEAASYEALLDALAASTEFEAVTAL